MPGTKTAFFISIVIFVSASGCSRSEQGLKASDDSLVPVYSKLILLSENFKSPSSHLDSAGYQREVRSLLAGNGMTPEQFSERLRILSQSPEAFQQFSEKVRKALDSSKAISVP